MSLKIEILTGLASEYIEALYTGLSVDSVATNAEGDTKYTKEAQRQFVNRYDHLEKQFDRLLANFGSEYTDLKEALVGASPNWTHAEVVERALELVDLGSE